MDGQDGQKKTCRKKQHVEIYIGRYAPKTIRRLAAVGKNNNSTRDILLPGKVPTLVVLERNHQIRIVQKIIRISEEQ